MFFKKLLVVTLLVSFFSNSLDTGQGHSAQVDNLSESEKLSHLQESYFFNSQKNSPEFATYVGLTKKYNGIWTDHSEAGYFHCFEILNSDLKKLYEIDRQGLSLLDQLNYDLFEKDLKNALEGYQFESYYMPLDQLGGVPLDVENLLMMMPRETLEDYGDILSRLKGIPRLIDQTLHLLSQGLDKGLTPPQVVLRSLGGSIKKMIPSLIETSVFFQPFVDFPDSIDKKNQDQMFESAWMVIEQCVYPSYQKLHDYLVGIYIPNCRKTIAAKDLPNGANYYQYCVKKHTTTHLTPLEIHAIGLTEVERIEKEMEKILNEIKFSGSLLDYFYYLNNSPEFFFLRAEDLISGYKEITRFIDEKLHLLFGRLPKLPYEVVPVPLFSEEGQVSAYYVRGSLANGRPGRFFANTYDIGSRPKWQMESLSLHEAVPGHHFQLSLAQEIEDLPKFRRYNHYTAYIEGWGLYAESLGKELGLYQTPSNQMGRLIEEIWRGVRLVVDTGIHFLGWSREESIAYMMRKTGLGEREVSTEVDRYIVWPGQALAYKIGELSFQRWRQEAQKALGETFDIRAFHDMLLEQGALPLDICEQYVHAWIDKQLEN